MDQVLEGIRILDFSRYGAGPYSSMLLSDMGAEVIKVEKPGGEEDRNLGPFAPNGEPLAWGIIIIRNKKGITLKLRSARGQELMTKLVGRSDVVLHNFPPGSAEAKILDYDALRKIKEDIIVSGISGFGHYGPYSQRTCFDSIAQAMSGAMSFTGFPENPPTRTQVPVIDFTTGLFTALGIMYALYYHKRSGKGQFVDVALFDAALSMIVTQAVAAEYKLLGQIRYPQGNQSYYNLSNLFQARDGWVMVNVIGNRIWASLAKAIGREDLTMDPRFGDDMSRFLNKDHLLPIVSQWVSQRSKDEVLQILDEAHVPCGPVNTMKELVHDPHVKAREMIIDLDFPGVGDVPLPGVVPKLSETPGRVFHRAPRIGEHNAEVYCGLLGLSPKELARLQEEGVV